MQHAAQAAGKAEAADRAKMMHGHAAGNRRVVVHVNVAAQQRGVGHDHAAADAAIVGDVAAGHDEAVAAERGDAVFLFAAAVDRHAFADDVVVADDHLRVAAAIADVLRIAAEHGAGKDAVVLRRS